MEHTALIISTGTPVCEAVAHKLLSTKTVRSVAIVAVNMADVRKMESNIVASHGAGTVRVFSADLVSDHGKSFYESLEDVWESHAGSMITKTFIDLTGPAKVTEGILPKPTRVDSGEAAAFAAVVKTWDDVFEAGLVLEARAILAAGRLMQKHHPGAHNKLRIATTGSRLILYETGVPTKGPWIAAKIGIRRLSASLSVDGGMDGHNVRVSAVNTTSAAKPDEVADAVDLIFNASAQCHVSVVDLLPVKRQHAQQRRSVRNKGLSSHVVIVTGGSNGIGRTIAQALAAEGAHVALVGRDERALQSAKEDCEAAGKSRGHGGRVTTFRADVNDPERMKGVVASVYRMHGKITGLVYSAGINRRRLAIDVSKPKHREAVLTESQSAESRRYTIADPAIWKQMLDVNVSSAMCATQLVLPHLAEAAKDADLPGGPTLIFVSSIIARLPFNDSGGQVSYHVSKAALSAFGSSLHRDIARFGIKSVTFQPGVVDTALGNRAAGGAKPVPPDTVIQKSDMQLAAVYAFNATSAPAFIDFENVSDISGGRPPKL
ncbi:putative oxidoreductase [Diplonema papillatum]|nr:putative oxidoreductase [Diplonema papillatum]|eukprot:gene16202-24834_t